MREGLVGLFAEMDHFFLLSRKIAEFSRDDPITHRVPRMLACAWPLAILIN